MAEMQNIIEDVLVDPLEEVLFQVGRGIAQSQMELDKNSLATQVLIDNNKDLRETGIKAPWYHFPEVNIELKMALSVHGLAEKKEGKIQVVKFKIFSAPMNATYKNTFDFDFSGNSSIKAKLVSIPPPIEMKGA